MGGVEFLFDHIVDRDDDVGHKGIGLLKAVIDIDGCRVALQVRHVRDHVGHGDHVQRVLDDLGGVAVVGMIVPRPGHHDQVRGKGANDLDHLLAHLQRGQQRAVVVVEGDILAAQQRAGCRRLAAPSPRQGRAAHLVVPGVAVGQGDHLYPMSQPAVQRGNAAGVEVRVVGMGAKDKHAEGVERHVWHSFLACADARTS